MKMKKTRISCYFNFAMAALFLTQTNQMYLIEESTEGGGILEV